MSGRRATWGRLFFRLLGFGAAGADELNWAVFARNLFLTFAAFAAGLWLYFTYSFGATLRRSSAEALAARGGGLARAAARAAYVPLILKDEKALARLLDSYAGEPDLARLEVMDKAGKPLLARSWPADARGGFFPAEAAAETSLEYAEPDFPAERAGTVRVTLSGARTRRELRAATAQAAATAALLLLAVAGVFMLVVRRMTRRLMGLVEASRLAALDAAVQKRTSRYTRSLIEASLDPFLTISPEGRITDVNEAAALMTGVARERLIGTDFCDYFTEPGLAREGYRRAFAEGAVTDYPLTIRRGDGGLADVLYNASVYRDEAGGALGVFAAARDVTARKKAEEKLRAARHFLEMANRHHKLSPLLEEYVAEIGKMTGCEAVGIRILDEKGNIPYHAYRGFSRSFYESESPLSVNSDKCMCINVIKGTTDPKLPFYTPGGSFYMNGTTRFLATVSEEEKGKTRNVCNQTGYESVALAPVRFGGKILGLFHVADRKENMVPLATVELLEVLGGQVGAAIQRIFAEETLLAAEIKQRKELEELAAELRRSNQELEQFAFVASHDLQAPLRAIAGYVQLLKSRYREQLDAKAGQFVDSALGGVKRMQALINDLLGYSRVGRAEPPDEPVDLAVVAQTSLALMQKAITESGAEVDLGPLPVVRGNPGRMGQLFENLIGNALKYRGAAPPRITIRAQKSGEQWEFSVRDNGIGIEPQYFGRIFEIFQRLHTRAEYEGTGIGLAVCKKIVELRGGRIWVESKPGEGSVFKFTLPA